MSKNEIPIKITGTQDNKIATINGKSYSLLRYYKTSAVGPIFLAVAGRTPLRADDLAEHWRVLRAGQVYLACYARLFSYHLIAGDGASTDAPRWPKLKTPAHVFAFVGPTEESVKTQIRLTLERYHGKAINPDVLNHIYNKATRVPDECGGPPAYLIKAAAISKSRS